MNTIKPDRREKLFDVDFDYSTTISMRGRIGFVRASFDRGMNVIRWSYAHQELQQLPMNLC